MIAMNMSRKARSLLVAAVAGVAMLVAYPAHACKWYYLCIDELIPAAQSTGEWVWSKTQDVAVFAYRDVYGGFIKCEYSCTAQSIGGIEGACFPSATMSSNVGLFRTDSGCTIITGLTSIFTSENGQLARMRSAMDFINADTRSNFTLGLTTSPVYYSPKTEVHNRIAYFMDGYSTAASLFSPGHGDQAATTGYVAAGHPPAPVTVWPSAYTVRTTPSALAGMIVHEQDHTRRGAHDCGDSADLTEDGPYGTEIQWYAAIAKTGNPGMAVAQVDRDWAWDFALARTEQKICNEDAKARLRNLLSTPQTLLSRTSKAGQWCSDYTGQPSQYRWAGYATAGSTSPRGAYASSIAVSLCLFNAPTGAKCSFWECYGMLSRGASVWQSSIAWDAPPERAIDGNTDGNFGSGSVTHTTGGVTGGDWYILDLQSDQFITAIDIWNRTDCCSERLSNFYVEVYDSNWLWLSESFLGPPAGSPTTVRYPNRGLYGRYVWIQMTNTEPLSLAEVTVWGY